MKIPRDSQLLSLGPRRGRQDIPKPQAYPRDTSEVLVPCIQLRDSSANSARKMNSSRNFELCVTSLPRQAKNRSGLLSATESQFRKSGSCSALQNRITPFSRRRAGFPLEFPRPPSPLLTSSGWVTGAEFHWVQPILLCHSSPRSKMATSGPPHF